jgi:hypothetical protein
MSVAAKTSWHRADLCGFALSIKESFAGDEDRLEVE